MGMAFERHHAVRRDYAISPTSRYTYRDRAHCGARNLKVEGGACGPLGPKVKQRNDYDIRKCAVIRLDAHTSIRFVISILTSMRTRSVVPTSMSVQPPLSRTSSSVGVADAGKRGL